MLVEIQESAPGHFFLADVETNKNVLDIDNDYKALEIALSMGYKWHTNIDKVEDVFEGAYLYLAESVGSVIEPKDWWILESTDVD